MTYHAASPSDQIAQQAEAVSVESVLETFTPSHGLKHVSEINDDARFITSSGKYGPAIKIFAAKPYPKSFDKGELVAEVIADYTAGLPDVLFPATHSCVYLKKGWWKGYDSQIVAATGNECAPQKEDFAIEKRLDVIPGEGDTSALGTTRFDGELSETKHVKKGTISFGVTCGDEWCDINYKRRDRTKAHSEHMNGHKKGLYDEQYLAVQNAPGSTLEPGEIVATILPDASLSTLNEKYWDCSAATTPCDNAWKPAAQVMFEGSNANYATKFNFHDTQGLATLNVVRLRHNLDKADEMQWEASILRPDGTPGSIKHVVRKTHPPEIPAPAARWRFSDTDETMWLRCAAGCCEVTATDVAMVPGAGLPPKSPSQTFPPKSSLPPAASARH